MTITIPIVAADGAQSTVTLSNPVLMSSTAWPGQLGNPVGYAAAPGFPGTLTPWPGGSFTAGATYKYYIFDGKTGVAAAINAANVTFIGCYFGCSSGAGSTTCVTIGSSCNPVFKYCTFAPSPSQVGGSFPPMPPNGGGYTNWPTGSGVGIAATLGYQYGPGSTGAALRSAMTFDHCDIWGSANGCVFSHVTQTNFATYTDCWIHDARNPSLGDHTDGLGDVQSSANDVVSFLTVHHCTIASVGNTQGIALQMQSSDTMTNCTFTNNYVAGFGYTINMGNVSGFTPNPYTNILFTDNVIGASPAPGFGPLYSRFSTPFNTSGSGNVWRRNTFQGGTNNGKYLWPDGSINATDWAGVS
jgi:hypothetical protein